MAPILHGFNDPILRIRSKLFSMICSLWSGPCLFFWFHFSPHPLPGTKTNYSPLLKHTKPSHLHTCAHTIPPAWDASPSFISSFFRGSLCLPFTVPIHPGNDVLNVLLETAHVYLVHCLSSRLSTGSAPKWMLNEYLLNEFLDNTTHECIINSLLRVSTHLVGHSTIVFATFYYRYLCVYLSPQTVNSARSRT